MITAADFATAEVNPAHFNGWSGMVDMGSVSDFVSDDYKWRLNDAHNPDPVATIACRLDVLKAKNVTLSFAELAVANTTQLGLVFGVSALIHNFAKCQRGDAACQIIIRASDQFPEAASEEATEISQKFLSLWSENAVMREKANQQNGMILMAVLANAIHRKQKEGHNWITAEMDTPSTPAHRALDVATTAQIDAFSSFMSRHGHGLLHFLGDICLYDLADALSGENPAEIGENIVVSGSEKAAGTQLHRIYVLNEKATKRWPPSVFGGAALHIALSVGPVVIQNLASKIHINAAVLTTRMARLKTQLNGMDRANLTATAAAHESMTAMLIGYASELEQCERILKGKRALDKFSSHPSYALGIAVAKVVKSRADNEAASAKQISAMADSLIEALGVNGDEAEVYVPMTPEDIKHAKKRLETATELGLPVDNLKAALGERLAEDARH